MTLDCLAQRRRRDHGAVRADRPRQRLARRLGRGDRRGLPRHPADRERRRTSASPGATTSPPREARGEYLLLLNPDTLVLDRAIDRLVAFAERTPEAGIWGGRTLNGDRTLNPMQRLRRPDALEPVLPRHRPRAGLHAAAPSSTPRRWAAGTATASATVDVVQGSFFLIRRDALGARSAASTATFVMYGEEADLCRRARAARRPAADDARGDDRPLPRRLVAARRPRDHDAEGAGDADPPALPGLAAAARAVPARVLALEPHGQRRRARAAERPARASPRPRPCGATSGGRAPTGAGAIPPPPA